MIARSIACSYTKRPKTTLAVQIREFLLDNGAATAGDIRHGIAKSKEAARFIVMDVATCCNRMADRKVLSRERRAQVSWYSIDKRRVNGERFKSAKGIKNANSMLSTVTKLAALVKPDIRQDVIAEMYMRIASGEYVIEQFEALLTTCSKWVRQELRGGWRENLSMDQPLGDSDTFKVLDTIPNEEAEFQKLFLIEMLADEIIQMQRDGYTAEQIEHLWCSAGTSWLHRVVA